MPLEILSAETISCGNKIKSDNANFFLYCLCEEAEVEIKSAKFSLNVGDAIVLRDNISVNTGENILALHFSDANFDIPFCEVRRLYSQKSVAETLFSEMNEKPELYLQNANALLTQLLIAFARADRKESNDKTQKILTYIAAHYKEDLTNSALGEIFSFHPNYINRIVNEQTGLSLHRYVLKLRIDEAVNLLRTTTLSAREIAAEVGFCDYNHFLRYFKQITKLTTKSIRLR